MADRALLAGYLDMVLHLISAKQPNEPMRTPIEPQENNVSQIRTEIRIFISRKSNYKCRISNGGHFVQCWYPMAILDHPIVIYELLFDVAHQAWTFDITCIQISISGVFDYKLKLCQIAFITLQRWIFCILVQTWRWLRNTSTIPK